MGEVILSWFWTTMKKRIPLTFVLIALLVGVGILVDYLRGVPRDAQATYVGSGKCAECHQSEFDRWHASPHDRAMDLANSETVLGDFDSARLTYQGVTSRMFREGDRYMIHTEGPDGEMDDLMDGWTYGCMDEDGFDKHARKITSSLNTLAIK